MGWLLELFLMSLVVKADWVDKDTEEQHKTTLSSTGITYSLVMSDEFNEPGRNFANGFDSRWTALDSPDTVNEPLAYYHPKMATTGNGSLVISTDNNWHSWETVDPATQRPLTSTRKYRSAMLQSWNKFCFTGGILELRVKLPGVFNASGLWPAAWLMGNLGRATCQLSTEGVWPFSFNQCEPTDQRISACNDAESGTDLNPHQGRGAPEIDVFEALTNPDFASLSSSLHLGPPRPADDRPVDMQKPLPGQWYEGMEYGDRTTQNFYYYGARAKDGTPVLDTISAITPMNKTFFDEFHKFTFEWVTGREGWVKWFLDDQFLFEIPASAITDSVPSGKQLPEEPMYIVLNTAVSFDWSPVCQAASPKEAADACDHNSTETANKACCLIFPAQFLIDYVRVYQPADAMARIGCSPRDYPTAGYIEKHAELYGTALLPVNPPPPPFAPVQYPLSVSTVLLELALLAVGASLSIFATRFLCSMRRRSGYEPIAHPRSEQSTELEPF